MASHRKYAALPDLDSAPDIYETPDLTDDTSTVPPTTVRSPSDNESDDDDALGISRSRLRLDQARSRFLPANVDARDVDFSDRLDSKRKSYKASTRRPRVLEDGTEEFGDISDEDGSESLARKIARLKREVEEAKEEYGKQKETTNEAAGQDEEIASLSRALDGLSRSAIETIQRPTIPPASRSAEPKPADAGETQAESGAISTYTVTYAPTYEQTHALARAADFDRRLMLLEKALGVGSAAMPEVDSNGLPRAILPTLETLQKQISTLSEASTSSLDTISRRVRTLAQEADNLEKSRRNAKAAQEALASAGGGATVEGAPAEDSEQTAKINALYGTLPTIENLTPLLPPLLERLRSLRAIHADAATANEALERIEQRQADMAADVQQWREGLGKVEAAIQSGESSMAGNMKVVEGWVKELEERMAKLS